MVSYYISPEQIEIVLNKGVVYLQGKKSSEKYIFRWEAGQEYLLLEALDDLVRDRSTDFNRFDATYLVNKLTGPLIREADYLINRPTPPLRIHKTITS